MFRTLVLMFASFAVQAAPVTVSLDGVPLPDLIRLTYGEIAKKPYVLTPAIYKDDQLVSINLRDSTDAKILDHVAAILEGSGYSVTSRAGVFFIDKWREQTDEIIHYRPRNRSASYLLDLVTKLIPSSKQIQRMPAGEVPQAQGRNRKPQLRERSESERVRISGCRPALEFRLPL